MKPKEIESREFKRDLLCEIPAAEMSKIGGEMAAHHREIQRLDTERRIAMDGFKQRMSGHKISMADAAEMLSSAKRLQPVSCREDRDFKRGTLRVVRLDTNETVEERTLTLDERQPPLFDGDEPGELEPVKKRKPKAAAEPLQPAFPKKRGRKPKAQPVWPEEQPQ